jgi:hypothetical protein
VQQAADSRRTPQRHTRSTERAHTSRATKRRWSAKTACTLGFRDTPRARNRIWSAMTACTLLRSLLAGCPPLPARQPVSAGTAKRGICARVAAMVLLASPSKGSARISKIDMTMLIRISVLAVASAFKIRRLHSMANSRILRDQHQL